MALDTGTLIEVQMRLKELGFYTGEIDAIRGPLTNRAIIEFKKSIGYRARDYVGPLTLAALDITEDSTDEDLPPWFAKAMSLRGLHERRDVSALRKALGKAFAAYDPREIPWCGAFIDTCIRHAFPGEDTVDNPLGARNWLNYGVPTTPRLGAIMDFWRGSPNGWKGHVGFYVGEDETHYHILGGNQSNAVTVTRVAKSRFLGARWPRGAKIDTDRVFLTPNGVPVTTNEA